MTYKILPFILFIATITFSCGKKNKEVQVKHEVVTTPVIKKDTIPPAPEPEPEPEPIIVEAPANKYFLISGSFSSKNNAETYKNELIQQGYDSEVIIRKTGRNQEFYKVSYKGFVDRDKAFNQLSTERKLPNNEDVWLLINR